MAVTEHLPTELNERKKVITDISSGIDERTETVAMGSDMLIVTFQVIGEDERDMVVEYGKKLGEFVMASQVHTYIKNITKLKNEN